MKTIAPLLRAIYFVVASFVSTASLTAAPASNSRTATSNEPSAGFKFSLPSIRGHQGQTFSALYVDPRIDRAGIVGYLSRLEIKNSAREVVAVYRLATDTESEFYKKFLANTSKQTSWEKSNPTMASKMTMYVVVKDPVRPTETGGSIVSSR